jgi:hypothetical protein
MASREVNPKSPLFKNHKDLRSNPFSKRLLLNMLSKRLLLHQFIRCLRKRRSSKHLRPYQFSRRLRKRRSSKRLQLLQFNKHPHLNRSNHNLKCKHLHHRLLSLLRHHLRQPLEPLGSVRTVGVL